LYRNGIGAKVVSDWKLPVDHPAGCAAKQRHRWPEASRLLKIESRGTMNDRLAILTSARERMLEDRDQFAKTLAGPPDRERSERARSKFLELQTLIEAIERAIDGERRRAEPGPTTR
jgi:hypothetical protein